MIKMILAVDKNNLIGRKNALPWHYKEDLEYFKKITLNKTVVMGENTFNSIIELNKKPLPNRKNVVATFNHAFHYDGVEAVYDLESYLKNVKEDVFLIGGKTIYEKFVNFVEEIYLTYIDHEHEGDVYLDLSFLKDFSLVKETKSGVLSFRVYWRKK